MSVSRTGIRQSGLPQGVTQTPQVNPSAAKAAYVRATAVRVHPAEVTTCPCGRRPSGASSREGM
eukprot:7391108-Prymnesium_polylepis.1